MEAAKAAFADPRFRSGMTVLFDNRGSKENASADEIQRRAEMLGRFAREGKLGPKCAVVVDDALHFGLARMGEAFANVFDVELGVFTEMDEAFRWLTAPAKQDSPAKRV